MKRNKIIPADNLKANKADDHNISTLTDEDSNFKDTAKNNFTLTSDKHGDYDLGSLNTKSKQKESQDESLKSLTLKPRKKTLEFRSLAIGKNLKMKSANIMVNV